MATQGQSASTVTVGCRLPNGIILRTFEMVDTAEVGPTQTRYVKQARFTGREHKINGNSFAQNKAPMFGQLDNHGYALTHNVPADLWNEWKEQNKDADILKFGHIFAHGEEKSVRAEANEKRDVKTGLERLDTKKLPRKIEKAEVPR